MIFNLEKFSTDVTEIALFQMFSQLITSNSNLTLHSSCMSQFPFTTHLLIY